MRKLLSDALSYDSAYAMVTSGFTNKNNQLEYSKCNMYAAGGSIYNNEYCDNIPNVYHILEKNKWLEKEIIQLSKQKTFIDHKDISSLIK